jgi:N-formylglutamate deformylase
MSQFTFSNIPFFVTMPHSGEKIPDQCYWLKKLPEQVVMCDVDRYVDVLYQTTLEALSIPFIKTEWHRYAVDLNRVPTDIDESSVKGSVNPAGKYQRGFHWVVTTYNDPLMPAPISLSLHQELTELIYRPFHDEVHLFYQQYRLNHFKNIFHLDAHSMPSLGTAMHRDPGQKRADVVISDSLGQSCHKSYRDLVIAAYVTAGFKVGYNWPYVGGRLTEQYGRPQNGQHAIQVEVNRDLYMDEKTKKLKPESEEIKIKIANALSYIKSEVPKLKV